MSQAKLKIFISAYACEPNLGSEIGVGWHWVLQMSQYFELWVLTRQSNKESIENWLKVNPTAHTINFVYYDLPKKLRFWKKGLRGVRTYYILWQKLTNRIVKRTMQENEIGIYHLLTYGNALWPLSNYGQKQFFIWGPTSVGDVIPAEYAEHYNLKGRLIEFLRRLSAKTLPFNRGFNKRCENANLIFCKTIAALNSIPKQNKDKAIAFTDVAVEMIDTSMYSSVKTESNKIINYFTAGRLDAWRGFDVLIEAFALASKNNASIRLEILGKGSDKERLKALIEKLNMSSYITLGGQVSMEDYYQKMANCDVVINPSLKEGAVTTAFDSMSFGKPLICIDTGGYTRYFNNKYAIVIPRTSRKEVISKLTDGILQLTDKDLRIRKGEKAKEIGKQFGWKQKGVQIHKEIENRYKQFLINEK